MKFPCCIVPMACSYRSLTRPQANCAVWVSSTVIDSSFIRSNIQLLWRTTLTDACASFCATFKTEHMSCALLLLLTSDWQTVLQSDTILSLSLCFPLNVNFCWSGEGPCVLILPIVSVSSTSNVMCMPLCERTAHAICCPCGSCGATTSSAHPCTPTGLQPWSWIVEVEVDSEVSCVCVLQDNHDSCGTKHWCNQSGCMSLQHIT